MCTLNELQRRQVYLKCNCIPLQRLAELCMNPSSGITIEGLREAGCTRIDQLATLCQHKDSGQRHPNNDKQNKAEENIRNQKCLLEDMKRNPSDYHRETMHEIITTNMLSREDLVDKYAVLTDRAYEHIRRYPHLRDEQRELPLPHIENPCSEHGNIDVYFLGVHGSGITCILAGLVSLAGQHGFRIDPRGSGGGGAYAMELFNYTRASMIPPSTDSNHIWVIDTQVDDDNGCRHKVSLIEMSEEKIFEDLKTGSYGLLPNENKKVLLFVIDLTKEDRVVTNDGMTFCVKQRNILEHIINLLSRNESILKNVTAIHFILTKSDALGDRIDDNEIRERLTSLGYTALLSQIRKVCEIYYINKSTGFQVGLYPFSIGKFMPGDVYSFDETDSLKILRLLSSTPIRPCVYGPPSPRGLIGKLINWLNS